jgi:hypothetical protein
MRLTQAVLTAAFALALAGCAGPPPPGEQASAGHRHTRCEHTTGSMLCSTPDDEGLASANSPAASTPSANLSQGVTGSSH